MPYIGNDLATQFQAFATQTITGDGSTGYTLDRAVANGKELLVYINNVKQEEGSGKSYTASGTTITFSEAVASGDSCNLVYMVSAQQTVTAPAGSIVSSQFTSADLVLPKTVTIGSAAEEDTKLVFDGNAQDYHVGLDDSADKLTMGVGSTLGTNTAMSIDSTGRILMPLRPCFFARGNNEAYVQTDPVPYPTAEINVGSSYNTSTYKFTAPIAGIYTFFATAYLKTTAGENGRLQFSKNDATDYEGSFAELYNNDGGAIYSNLQTTVILNLSASDTIKVTFTGNGDYYNGEDESHFGGYLLG